LLFGLEGYGIVSCLMGGACTVAVVILVLAPKLWDIMIEFIADLLD
jgi:hypothetical protein